MDFGERYDVTILKEFPSPHSGILFLFEAIGQVELVPYSGFRPLIRGFFFYLTCYGAYGVRSDVVFPSPHSGILFLLIMVAMVTMGTAVVSVPSFGDSFFIPTTLLIFMTSSLVSVPSFGDSFFMKMKHLNLVLVHAEVSVPSFGDSFFITVQVLRS